MEMHPWDVSITEATMIQKRLRDAVSLVPLIYPPRTIAGADISFNRFSTTFHAGMIVLSYPDLVEIEHVVHTMEVHFPYVPGYLSFREVPALAEAYAKLRTKPDVVMMDGHGIAHPRRLGVATHLGLVIDAPTIGCAKRRLYGTGEMPAEEAGSVSFLHDPQTEELIGAYLRTKTRVQPVIISPGQCITLDESLAIARVCTRGYRLPEPTRRAHLLVNAFRRGEIGA